MVARNGIIKINMSLPKRDILLFGQQTGPIPIEVEYHPRLKKQLSLVGFRLSEEKFKWIKMKNGIGQCISLWSLSTNLTLSYDHVLTTKNVSMI